MKRIPILLLTGYLGSGKTTLVNNILSNKSGVRFAVIVNDIGEINIDAELIQKGGVVGQQDKSLVSLQNGCICCTLQTELVDQIFNIMKMECFDYVIIEASGLCEPEPILQTLCSIPQFGGAYVKYGYCYPDCIVSIVDALRLQNEFSCGQKLIQGKNEEIDIKNLIIRQIEFCNIILLNKSSEVSAKALKQIKLIIKILQPEASIIECNYANVDLDKILFTGIFNYGKTATSAGWIRYIGEETPHGTKANTHHHGNGEVNEYGIDTLVYYNRKAFDIQKFDNFVTKWSQKIIRAKGICYFSHNYDISFVFEQVGMQTELTENGLWYASMPDSELIELKQKDPELEKYWDEKYGDRMQKIVFIGQYLDKKQFLCDLDECIQI